MQDPLKQSLINIALGISVVTLGTYVCMAILLGWDMSLWRQELKDVFYFTVLLFNTLVVLLEHKLFEKE